MAVSHCTASFRLYYQLGLHALSLFHFTTDTTECQLHSSTAGTQSTARPAADIDLLITTLEHGVQLQHPQFQFGMILFSSLLVNSRVERCRTDDLTLNVPISCLPTSRVDPEVQGLKVINHRLSSAR